MSVIDEVRAVNQAFYDAHEARDLASMAAVWLHDDSVVCVHPGWPVLRGWWAVEESWRRIFEGPGRTQFILTNQSVAVKGDAAWVTVEENLVDRGHTNTVAATNVFARVRTDAAADPTTASWRLVVHHGSPVLGGRRSV